MLLNNFFYLKNNTLLCDILREIFWKFTKLFIKAFSEIRC